MSRYKYLSDREKKINLIASTIACADIPNDPNTLTEYISCLSQVMCEFDTDIAIDVLGKLDGVFKEDAEQEILRIKMYYGY
jgi:hypothetical protein